MKKVLIALASCLFVSSALPLNVLSEEQYFSSGSDDDMQAQSSGEVTSMDAISNTAQTSGAFARSAEYCLNHGQIDKAIKLCQQALNIKDDPDLHQIYAEALERKLKTQVDKDPQLFRKCVREWLIVLRQSGGEENLSFHGLSIPGEGKFFEDEAGVIPAKQHITQLAGRLPKVWETDERFLNRVTKESEAKVSGKVVPSKSKRTEE